jgi:hypothetical protein
LKSESQGEIVQAGDISYNDASYSADNVDGGAMKLARWWRQHGSFAQAVLGNSSESELLLLLEIW